MTTAEAIRATIVTALEEVGAGERVSPTALAAFEAGAADIDLADAGLDSLGRMELLVALELEHDVVVAPSVLFSLRSFAEASWRTSSASGRAARRTTSLGRRRALRAPTVQPRRSSGSPDGRSDGRTRWRAWSAWSRP